ncbi:hypothetical protein Nizo2535_2885 [Lactiplantibacillus plantarum]|nr:hypothetical protein GBLP1_g2150 [Lactiplantibacillus plantarum]KZU11342.1 hypothetical protein Nizo2457_3001 [Lactiplantibacillus plantarum]KZU26569.1 hypothetical protein Nizo2535_2885 [Lactiplantibacillus plantarum]
MVFTKLEKARQNNLACFLLSLVLIKAFVMFKAKCRVADKY